MAAWFKMAGTRTKFNQLFMSISNEFPYSFGIYVKWLVFDMALIKISIPQSPMAAKYNMAASSEYYS